MFKFGAHKNKNIIKVALHDEKASTHCPAKLLVSEEWINQAAFRERALLMARPPHQTSGGTMVHKPVTSDGK